MSENESFQPVRSTLLTYGAETWTYTVQKIYQFMGNQQVMKRAASGVSEKDRIRYETIWYWTKAIDIAQRRFDNRWRIRVLEWTRSVKTLQSSGGRVAVDTPQWCSLGGGGLYSYPWTIMTMMMKYTHTHGRTVSQVTPAVIINIFLLSVAYAGCIRIL